MERVSIDKAREECGVGGKGLRSVWESSEEDGGVWVGGCHDKDMRRNERYFNIIVEGRIYRRDIGLYVLSYCVVTAHNDRDWCGRVS